jgi:hypothetical protein
LNEIHSDHYWPMDTVPVYYGDIKVTLLNDSHYPDWIVTEFMMQRVRKSNRISCIKYSFCLFRAKFNVSSDTSTSQHGQISACQIHLKPSPVLSGHSGSALDQRQGQLSFTAVRVWEDLELSSH